MGSYPPTEGRLRSKSLEWCPQELCPQELTVLRGQFGQSGHQHPATTSTIELAMLTMGKFCFKPINLIKAFLKAFSPHN